MEDERGRAEVVPWGEIRVDLKDGRTSWWKFPETEYIPEGSYMLGEDDREGVAKSLAMDLIRKLTDEQHP